MRPRVALILCHYDSSGTTIFSWFNLSEKFTKVVETELITLFRVSCTMANRNVHVVYLSITC